MSPPLDGPPTTGDRSQSKGGRLAKGKDADSRLHGPPWARKEKPKNFRAALSKLFGYIGKYRYHIYFGAFLSMIGSLLTTIGPQYLKDITNLIYAGIGGTMDMAAIFGTAMIVVALYTSAVVFNAVQHYIIPSTSERVANLLRIRLTEKIGRLPLNYYDNSSTGDIMSRLTHDADTIGETCGNSLSTFVAALSTLTGCLVLMFYTCPTLALVSIIPPVVGFVVTRVIIIRTHSLFVRQARNMGAMNGHVEEAYYGHSIIRIYNGEAESRRRFVEINDDLYDSVYKSRFMTSVMPQLMGFIGNLGYVLVCVFGTMLVIQGQTTYGVIVAFIVYVRMFNIPLLQLSDSFSSMQTLAASAERVFDLLDAPEMEDESHKNIEPGTVKGDIEFRDVTFSYIEGQEIIHHFNLDVKAGERIAIVGPTGAGKTTVVNLLMRFYEVDSGDILIDGISTKDLRREQVHDMFSMVLQDAWLFNGTVRSNLLFNREGISEEKMFEACRSVGVHDMILGLPEGYDTVLNESVGLSAGQKQQLAIARAILHSAPMVIFDEATSSVDTRTEKRIQAAVDELTRDKTSFIIAHRLSTIKNCDKIIVMKDGRIIESGTHEDLLKAGGFYTDLYNSQFENCS